MKNFTYKGELYEYLSHKFIEEGGVKSQITDFRLHKKDGTFQYPYFICKVPENTESVDVGTLSEECKKGLIENGKLS